MLDGLMPLARRGALLLALPLVAAGCEGDGPTDPRPRGVETAQVTVDASTGWAFLDLGTPAVPVTLEDPAVSGAWDMGFNATSVKLNGGAEGPGGVVAYCLCQNAGASDDAVLAMTPDTELAEFEAVTAAQIPAAGAPEWSAEVFETAKWYRYNLTGNHQISPTYEVYLVKRGSDVYKVQLIGYYGPAGETRRITIRYAPLAD